MADVQADWFGGDGGHVRRDRPRPRGAPGDDRGDPADARRRDRVVPGPDARSSPASPTSRAAAARRRRAAPRAAARSTTRSRRECPPSGARPSSASGLEDLFAALEDLGENPITLLALRDLRTGGGDRRAGGASSWRPYQTVCNYLVYFFTPLGTHQSEAVPGGTAQRILAKLLYRRPAEQPRHHRVDPPGGRAATRIRRRPAEQALHKQPAARRWTRAGEPTARPARPGYPQPARDRRRATRRDAAGGFRRRRQPRRGRSGHARAGRRHLQVTRSSASTAWGTCPDEPPFKAGAARARPDRRRWSCFAFTKVQPVREPLRAAGGVPRRPEHQVRRAGADRGRGGGQGDELESAGRRGGRDRDDGAARRRAADPRGRPARDPPADPARGQLLRRPAARARRRAGSSTTAPPCRSRRPPTSVSLPDMLAVLNVGHAHRPPDAAARVRHGGARRRAARRRSTRRSPRSRPPTGVRALTNDALLGRASPKRDLQPAAARPAARAFGALASRPGALQDLVTDLDVDGRRARQPGRRARGVGARAARHAARGLPGARPT